MKDLTLEELSDAPTVVAYIYRQSMFNVPISKSLFKKAMTKHPEYFPEEVAHKKKWESIPQEVHDAYRKEWRELYEKKEKEMPEGKGIIYIIDHPEEEEKWTKQHNKVKKKYEPLEKKLHQKYYAEYGIEWKGF